MCVKCKQVQMAGLHSGHQNVLQEFLPGMADVIGPIYSAMTQNLNPHLPVLTGLIAMVEAFNNGDFGVLGGHRLVRLPLSIIGTDKVRYRTPMVEMLHESVLSMRMSDLTVGALRSALKPHGLCVLFLCSCGVVVGNCRDVKTYYGSEDHRRMDRLRSAIDAEGNPVVLINSFDEITVPTMDLHSNGAEARLFARIEELTKAASKAGFVGYDWIQEELNGFVQMATAVELSHVA